ncbi:MULTISPECIES: TetR/AcrR family transcriptional regulator [Streptomyces]|uniref:TetR/AcrR family transcriptional regulator n=1 Tax=Streptomyces buecherae TaxID=2763006 RepID=A0A7H8N3M8_9ACTN|nr:MULTISPECIES: TetR/AcrR family transcriptional regulator [Streptomyces]QKW48986.1 TetR/AcrR family transcriptional regulator [Streptomyces buecherae]WEV28777.1 TetR/AcrR family transcriptional regulator [Streptomyces sp. 71268]
MTRSPAGRQLSTAEERRETVLRTAVGAFAARGYYGTTTGEVAKAAGISQAYVYRLFPDKETLFVAVIEHCSTRMRAAFAEAAARATSSDPASVLDALGDAYARLVADKDLLLVMLQAKCAASEPAIRDAVRATYAREVEYVRAVSGAGEEDIQRFFARGFLCDALIAMGADEVDAPWSRTLLTGIRHY